jgi:hypothetical protein
MIKISRLPFAVPVLLCAGLLLSTPAYAQQDGGAAATSEQAQWDSVVLVMKGELARAEARAESVTAQLIALDGDMESRIDRMIALLAKARDSVDGPGNRIRKSKEEALAGIKATAVYYAQERDKRRNALASGNARIEDDVLARQVAVLNARIETRVTQSLAIAESLVRPPENASGSGDFHETAEQRKVRYDGQASVKIKADLLATLRASIDKQTREIAMRDEALRTAVDPQKRDQLTRDNEVARQVMAARRNQIEELITAPKASTRAVASKAAFELDQLLDDMTAELRRDFAKFKSLVSEGDEARARVKILRDRVGQAASSPSAAAGGAVPARVSEATK